ncbi:MAG: hypothetical protein LC723_00595 [Actinobacteria bacterium]|nr:hypothetical protein [Actinomycetota bacterium]
MVIAACLLALGLVCGSVALALAGRSSTAIETVKAALPESLFVTEPSSEKMGRVDAGIAAEASPSPTTTVSVQPSPSPSRAKKPAAGASPSPTAQAPVSPGPAPSTSASPQTGMSVALTGKARPSGNAKTVSYDGTIANTGQTTLSALTFSSHVPEGSTWPTDSACGGSGHLVVITYHANSEDFCIDGSSTIAGSSDPAVHVIDIALSGKTLQPGESIKLTWVVTADPQTTSLANHDHASSGNVSATSDTIMTKVR